MIPPARHPPVTVFLSADEWREIQRWMWHSLENSELSPYGHLLLECAGTERFWVATDTQQMTVLQLDGPAPRGVRDADGLFTVQLSPRLFNGRVAKDATLTVSWEQDRRIITLDTDGVLSTLPETTDDRADWRPVASQLDGVAVTADAAPLRDALAGAQAVPFGTAAPDPLGVVLSVHDGSIELTSRWQYLPSTHIRVPAATSDRAADVFVDAGRLESLLRPIEHGDAMLVIPRDGEGAIGIRSGGYLGILQQLDPLGGYRRQLEGLLCEILHTDRVTPDAVGDYSISGPTGFPMFARLVAAEPVTVRVSAVVAPRVEPRAELFQELNAINATTSYIKLLWADGAVVIGFDLVAGALTAQELYHAIDTVHTAAGRYSAVLGTYFGPTDHPSTSD